MQEIAEEKDDSSDEQTEETENEFVNQSTLSSESKERTVQGWLYKREVIWNIPEMDNQNSEDENSVKLVGYQRAAADAPPLPIGETPPPPPTPPPPLPPPPLSLLPPPRPTEDHPSRGHSDIPESSTANSSLRKRMKEDKVVNKRDHVRDSRSRGMKGTSHMLSCLYAKLLVVAAGVLVCTEILQNQVPFLFYHGYLFTYLIGGAVVCLICVYFSLLLQKCPGVSELEEMDEAETETCTIMRRVTYPWPTISIFFRIGALIFGLGTLTGIGLEMATFLTMEEVCLDKLNFFQPLVQALFTFMQMHFLCISAQKAVHNLGWFRHVVLMHLVAANLAVWLRLVVWETSKEWLDTTHISYNNTEPWPPTGFNFTLHTVDNDGKHTVQLSPNCWWVEQEDEKMEGILFLRQCSRNTTIGNIYDKALPFILPFIVQYCLVGAAVNYVLWDCMNNYYRRSSRRTGSWSPHRRPDSVKKRRDRKVDCKGSSKGLFLGLLVLAVGIVVLILFFLLNNSDNLKDETLFIMIAVHGGILGISTLALLLGLCKIQSMCPSGDRQHNLHTVLQNIGVAAVYIHGCCSLVVGATDIFSTRYLMLFIDGALMIMQSITQSIFFHQVSQKCCSFNCEHSSFRPGRQVVTFLAFANLVLWITESFTDQNHVSTQLQLEFFGILPWGIISRLVVPLVVFYRFHSSVFLMEVWKTSYNLDN